MIDEPAKKRLKSESEFYLPEINHEEKEDNQLDKQIEQEEKKADNLVIKDLMGSVKPEPNKVIKQKIYLKKNHFFI
jgi:hypothetical protein